MNVERIINNNVVSALDLKGREVIVMGKGIGFHAKKGKEIDQTMIEKVFRLESQTAFDKFKQLIENLPIEHIQVSNEIITYANKVLKRELNPNIYITLTDHISFAIERFRKGMEFENPLLWDVQNLYRKEYLIGEYSVALIDKRIGIRLPVDEAASIALHIVNAEYNTVMRETVNITKIIPGIVKVVKDTFLMKLEEQSIPYERFVSYLKSLARRILKQEQLDHIDEQFCEMVEKLYPNEFQCGVKIAEILKTHFQQSIAVDELAMLTIQIRRIVLGNQKND